MRIFFGRCATSGDAQREAAGVGGPEVCKASDAGDYRLNHRGSIESRPKNCPEDYICQGPMPTYNFHLISTTVTEVSGQTLGRAST